MTTSDEFSLLAEAPKDRWGRYKISDPASGKERGYTRVTTIAKVLDDSSSLADCKTRMAIPASFNEPICLLRHQQRWMIEAN